MRTLQEMSINIMYGWRAFKTAMRLSCGAQIDLKILVDGPAPIVISDELIEMITCLPSEIPLAATMVLNINGHVRPAIIVNQKTKDQPNVFSKAVMMHEAGHIDLGHLEAFRKMSWWAKRSRSIEYEYEADQYAADRVGYKDVIDALRRIRRVCRVFELSQVISELNRRISRLTLNSGV